MEVHINIHTSKLSMVKSISTEVPLLCLKTRIPIRSMNRLDRDDLQAKGKMTVDLSIPVRMTVGEEQAVKEYNRRPGILNPHEAKDRKARPTPALL